LRLRSGRTTAYELAQIFTTANLELTRILTADARKHTAQADLARLREPVVRANLLAGVILLLNVATAAEAIQGSASAEVSVGLVESALNARAKALHAANADIVAAAAHARVPIALLDLRLIIRKILLSHGSLGGW